jgi:hypothetical protein
MPNSEGIVGKPCVIDKKRRKKPMRTQNMIKEINDAIGAHGMWKMRLRTAINSGAGDVHSSTARCDDKCAFGKWLYGPTLDAETRAGKPYQVIRRLHAEFHQIAGDVLASVENGNRSVAEQTFTGAYVEKSERLVLGLTKWKGELLRGSALGAGMQLAV